MKYKKQIAMICLITFLFFPMSVKYEEPKADILTGVLIGGVSFSSVPTGAIIACAGLAIAAGVIITHPDMLEDVGSRVFETVNAIPGALEVVGDKIKINATKNLLDTVVDVCNTLPKVEYVKSVIDSYLDDNIYGFGGYSLPSDIRVGSLSIMPLSGNDSSSTSLKIKISYGSYSFGTFNFPFDEPVDISFDLSSKDGKIFVNSVPYSVSYGGTLWQDYSLRLSLPSNWNGTWRVLGYESEQSICIPYTEKNTENVSSDKPLVYFPSGTGSISVPTDYPLDSYSPSVSVPITTPSDLALEGSGIVVEADSVTDGVTDDTTDNAGDGTLEGDGALDVPSVAGIDFSPLYISLSDYFPFCIPFDLYNMISDFQVSKEVPIFEVNFPEDSFIGGGTFTVDFSNYDKIVTIFRYFCLLFFVTNLIKITRRLIGNG